MMTFSIGFLIWIFIFHIQIKCKWLHFLWNLLAYLLSAFFYLTFCTSIFLILASKFSTSIVSILPSKLTRGPLWRVEIFAGYIFFGFQPEDTIAESLSAPYIVVSLHHWHPTISILFKQNNTGHLKLVIFEIFKLIWPVLTPILSSVDFRGSKLFFVPNFPAHFR